MSKPSKRFCNVCHSESDGVWTCEQAGCEKMFCRHVYHYTVRGKIACWDCKADDLDRRATTKGEAA